MKLFLKKINKTIALLCVLFVVSVSNTFAARIYFETEENKTSFNAPFVVNVLLDTQGEVVSGISGGVSFPSDMFTVYTIVTHESVVSPWVEYPLVSKEFFLNGRTHIFFEGIFAGGFSGVKSAYHEGEKPGKLFSFIVIPKKIGSASFLVEELSLLGFNEKATPISSVKKIPLSIQIPVITTKELPALEQKHVSNDNLEVVLSRSELIHANKWYISVTEKETYSPIASIQISETATYLAEMVSSREWKTVASPYILLFQDRSKYIHVKVEYVNGSYTYYTIAPVENLHTNRLLSRILLYIVCVIFIIVLLYVAKYKLFFKSKKKLTT